MSEETKDPTLEFINAVSERLAAQIRLALLEVAIAATRRTSNDAMKAVDDALQGLSVGGAK